jgi:hypothetical protein
MLGVVATSDMFRKTHEQSCDGKKLKPLPGIVGMIGR